MSEIHTDPQPFDLRLEGDMTIYRAAELKPQMLQALQQHPLVHLDLSGVTDIDSAGLQLVYLIQREAERLGTRLRVVAYSQVVVGLMSSLNLLELLDRMTPPPAEALSGPDAAGTDLARAVEAPAVSPAEPAVTDAAEPGSAPMPAVAAAEALLAAPETIEPGFEPLAATEPVVAAAATAQAEAAHE